MSITAASGVTRKWLPANFSFNNWEDLQPLFEELSQCTIANAAQLKSWLFQLNELKSFLAENMAWRYIRMSTDTVNPDFKNAYTFFVMEIQPKMAPYNDQFNRILAESPFAAELESDRAFQLLLRNTRKDIEIYREESIALIAEAQSKAQQFGAIAGAMTIEHEGREYTLPQAALLLESTDRAVRQAVFVKVSARRLQDKAQLNNLIDELIALRQQIAANANFNNFRDYKFEQLGRFDYNVQDCLDFHESIALVIKPLVELLYLERKKALKIESVKPYDLAVDFRGSEPLKPFLNGKELTEKGIEVLRGIDPFFAECLSTMQQMGHLDLDSRQGKAPGGYNYPLYESGYPFIFMNAAGTQNDLVTFVHESGHAVHSVLTQNLALTAFKRCPSEVAELASMSMELITMDRWDAFYPNPDNLKRAKLTQLERSLETLLWIATVDAFQHWLYENKNHTTAERETAWTGIHKRFYGAIDWSGYDEVRANLWQKQLHIYEVPFYYIEYGMAQLGAIAVWRNYRQNPAKALQQYQDALALGNTRSIPEVYEAAGIRFDFSAAYIQELADFVKGEMERMG
jgi:oligoendopeptidase F